jgi:hypothetical protein
MTPGSAPNRRFQKEWFSTTTGSRSDSNERPIANGTPRTLKYSCDTMRIRAFSACPDPSIRTSAVSRLLWVAVIPSNPSACERNCSNSA